MPKCPLCGKEISRVDERGVHLFGKYYTCPECERILPLFSWKLEDFLKEKYVILRPDDPEIKRKGDFALFRGRVYKIDKFYFLEPFLVLELVEDELVADILKADLEGEKDA